MKIKTEAAKAAREIKSTLKKRFPETKFRVNSENFAGGNAVNIHYKGTRQGPKPKEVEAIARKHQFGHFDGMTDSYNYSNWNDEIPQAKYVHVSVDTKELREEMKEEFMKRYGLKTFEDKEARERLGMWADQALYRFMQESLGWE